jgi:hypothetical protein
MTQSPANLARSEFPRSCRDASIGRLPEANDAQSALAGPAVVDPDQIAASGKIRRPRRSGDQILRFGEVEQAEMVG